MYRPDNLQNITYVWSNWEGLVGDDITFIVCRALISLAPRGQEIEKVVGIKGRNVIDAVSWHGNPKTVHGQLLVDLDLQLANDKEKSRFYKLALPFQAPVKSYRLGEINPEVKFLHAEKMGTDSLLVEGIISLTSLGYLPWRGAMDDLGGTFTDDSVIKLDKLLPEVKEMVCAQIKYNPFSHTRKEKTLILTGLKEVHLMYIAEESGGEKVVITRQVEPFTKEIYLNVDLSSLGYLEINNGNIESQVLGPREIMVVGNFQVIAQGMPSMGATNYTNEILKKIKEMGEIIKNKRKHKKEEINSTVTEERENLTEESINAPSNEGEDENKTPISMPVNEEIEESISKVEDEEELEVVSSSLPMEEIDSESQEEQETLTDFEEEIPSETGLPIVLEEKQEKVVAEESSSVIIPRESRRARLSKYMRNLK